MSDQKKRIQGIFQEVIVESRKGDKDQNHSYLSNNISQEMLTKLKDIYKDKRIIIRCIVTDSSDQVVAYSLSKKEGFGDSYVLRSFDDTFSFTCLVCLISIS